MSAEGRSAGGRALEGVTILVVEDHAASARMIAALLASAGAEVSVAETAEAALELLESFVPRVLVVDVVLPNAGGLALVARVKAEPRTQGIACIATTVVNGPETELAAYEAGCAAYVHKPIDTDSFATLIAQHLEGKS